MQLAARVEPTDPVVDELAPVGYADAFSVRARPGDRRTAEEWVRDGLDGTPRSARAFILAAQVGVLRLRLALGDPARVLGWRVVASDPDVVRITAEGPLVEATIVGRRNGDTVVLTTVVVHRRALGRVLWSAVAPAHRAVARWLVARAAAAGSPAQDVRRP